MFWYDGHSGGVTPGPIPNPEVKSARVSVCTVLRKRTGTQTRCQPLLHSISWPRGCFTRLRSVHASSMSHIDRTVSR